MSTCSNQKLKPVMNRINLIIRNEDFHKLEQFVEQVVDLSGIENTYYSNIASATGLVYDLLCNKVAGIGLLVEATSADSGLYLEFLITDEDNNTQMKKSLDFADIIGSELFVLQTLSDLCVVDERSDKLTLLFNTTAQFGIKARRRAKLLSQYFACQKRIADHLKC